MTIWKGVVLNGSFSVGCVPDKTESTDTTKLQRGSSCWYICYRGKTQVSKISDCSSEFSSWLQALSRHPTLFPSQFYIRPVWLLCNAWQSVEVCAVEGERRGAYFASCWRPSSRRLELPFSLAPSDTMRKWRSLNKVTWSSVWGCVTWSSSRQRSFTHTPVARTNTEAAK